jgi:hypothetical protein
MQVGRLPFYNRDQDKLFELILMDEVRFSVQQNRVFFLFNQSTVSFSQWQTAHPDLSRNLCPNVSCVIFHEVL